MTDLQVLNVAMEKLGHVQNMPMRLNILLNGAAHEIDVDQGSSKVQDLAHLLIIELLKREMTRTSQRIQISEEHLAGIPEDEAPTEYKVRVRMDAGTNEVLIVLAWQPRDARVMAYILAHPNCPIGGTPGDIFLLAMAATEIVE